MNGTICRGILFCILLVAVIGCQRERSGATATGVPPRALDRAVNLLLSSPEPRSLPDASVQGSRPDITRLTDWLARARIESSWRLSASDDFMLATFGPVSTDTSGDGVAVETRAGIGGQLYTWLAFEDIEVRREMIGEIVLRARFYEADYFLIGWPGVGGLRIDLEPGEEFREYVLPTEEFIKWRGPLRTLRIGVPHRRGPDSAARADVEFLGLQDRRAQYPDPAGVRRVRVGRVVQKAMYLHGSTMLEIPDLELPAAPRFSTTVAVTDQSLDLTLKLVHRAGEDLLFRGRVESKQAWTPLSSDRLGDVACPCRLQVEAEGPSESVLLLGSPNFYIPQASPPRVILYVIDTLGAVHTSLYGYKHGTTPNLERLGREGVWFPRSFSNGPWTPEAIPSLLTSLHTRSHGADQQFAKLAPGFFTLAEAFRESGYSTVAFSTNANAGPSRGTDQGFDAFFDHVEIEEDEGSHLTIPRDEVLSWIEANDDRPVFVYVHTAEPHHPYDPPPPFDHLFADPEYAGKVGEEWPAQHDTMRRYDGDEADRRHLVALYDGEVAYADHMLGEFLEALRRRGLLEGMLLAVTSDHGEEFGEHGYYGHGSTVYGELLRVPLVLWGPSYLKGAHAPLDVNVQLLDLMPTLLDFAGIEVSAAMQGDSLVPLLRDAAAAKDDFVERAILAAGRIVGRGPKFTLISGDWKLNVWTAGGEFEALELFNLATDPRERQNIADDRPQVVRDLVRQLVTEYADLPVYETQSDGRVELSREHLDRLRALGYLQ